MVPVTRRAARANGAVITVLVDALGATSRRLELEYFKKRGYDLWILRYAVDTNRNDQPNRAIGVVAFSQLVL